MTQTDHSNSTERPEKPIRVGVYETVTAADLAMENLKAKGFTTDEISVFCSEEVQKQHFQPYTSSSEEGAPVATASAGGALGATLGGLTAAVGLISTAGIPVVVAGAMAGVLSGSVVGGLAGAMMNRGVEKESADYFDQAVADGKILISVEPAGGARERLAEAAAALKDAGAHPISLLEG